MTTLAYLQGGGSRLGFVVAIEGYEYLLVDGSSVSAVAADLFTSGQGWEGTDWTQALSGLTWNPTITRSIEPWADKLDVPTAQFRVQGVTQSDQFGKDTHKRGAGNQTELAVALDVDDTTITVQDTGDFAASGSIWIGNERIKYTGKTAGSGAGDATFTGATRGYLHPFATKSGTANQFGQQHRLPSVDWDVAFRPRVTDEPRAWVGRMVGVWAHAIRDGVWDTVANARLVWAGIITDIADTPNGDTVVATEDIAAKLTSTVLLKDQFRGRISDGLRVHTFGVDVDCAYARMWSFTSAGTLTSTTTSPDLTITTAAAGSVDEIQEGYYSAEEICAAITAWLNNDGTIAGQWTIEVRATSEGDRTTITVDMSQDGGASGWNDARLVIPYRWANFLGFEGYETETFSVGRTAAVLIVPLFAGQGNGQLASAHEPARVWLDLREQVDLDSSQGTWINEPDWLPQVWQDQYVTGSEEWGILQVGQEVFALARRINNTSFEIRESGEVTRQFGGKPFSAVSSRIVASAGGRIEVRQVVMLQGSFKDIMARLFYSTGVTDHNATTFDEWPAQLGAAIPGSLLGTTFETSLDLFEQGAVSDALTVVIDKPTRLTDVIAQDLMLRQAYLTFDAGLVFVPMSPIVGGLATHTLNETTKRSAVVGDPQAAKTVTSREHVRNIASVKYNRSLEDDSYASHLQVIDQASAQDFGERPLSIKMPNTYGQYTGGGDTVESLAADLAGAVLPHWRTPVSKITLTISPKFYQGVKVGDIASITDNHARNPDTGGRGLAGKPGRIIAHRYSFGGGSGQAKKDMLGEVDVMITAVEDEAIYSPCAYVASYADPDLTLEAHAHTESTEAVDASFFVASDEILVLERDPTDPAAAQSFQVTVNSVSGNDLDVGTLAGFDAGKKYMVVSANYTTAVATQKTDAYMADDADLQIQDARQPYIWGALFASGSFTGGDRTTKFERHANEWFSDGFPVNPGSHAAAANFINNFISYKGTIHIPWMYEGGARTAPLAGGSPVSWYHIESRQIGIGVGYVQGQSQRKWNVAPLFRTTSAPTQARCRVTFSRAAPRGDAQNSITFNEPFTQLTFLSVSATFAVIATQTVEPIVNPETGRGFVTLELESVVGAQPEIWGFPKFYLGAFGA